LRGKEIFLALYETITVGGKPRWATFFSDAQALEERFGFAGRRGALPLKRSADPFLSTAKHASRASARSDFQLRHGPGFF
jgi:hypothetical protein